MKTENEIKVLAVKKHATLINTENRIVNQEDTIAIYTDGYKDGQQHGYECAKAENKQVSANFLRWVFSHKTHWFIFDGMAHTDWESNGDSPITFEQLFEIYLNEMQHANTK